MSRMTRLRPGRKGVVKRWISRDEFYADSVYDLVVEIHKNGVVLRPKRSPKKRIAMTWEQFANAGSLPPELPAQYWKKRLQWLLM
jgi:hypothetical protein